MACDCIAEINEKLAPEQKLDTSLTISRDLSRMSLTTYTGLMRKDGKRENRRSKPSIFAHAFCPFCGTKIHDEGAA